LEEKLKTSHNKQKLKELETTKPTLKKILIEILYIEEEEKCSKL
jgi:hypothetical protein